MDRYFLSNDGGYLWTEVSKQEWVATERGCGFRGGRDGKPSTGGFSFGAIQGAIGIPPAVLNGRGVLAVTPKQAAERIRDELVCCDVYEELSALYDPKDMVAYRAKLRSPGYHAICHYGEWAARIVERMGHFGPGGDKAAG